MYDCSFEEFIKNILKPNKSDSINKPNCLISFIKLTYVTQLFFNQLNKFKK